MNKPGLFIVPENVPPKFYIQHLYPYSLVKKVASNKIILDIGFGDGYGPFYLAEVADRVIGIDCEEDNVKIAQAKYKANNLSFKFSNATNMDFQNNFFDIVCSFQVIEHINEGLLSGYLKEASRVLKPTGLFFVSTLNKEVSMKPGQPYQKNPYHVKEFNIIELKNLLLSVFTEVEIYGLNLTKKHRFFQRLKKIGFFNAFPKYINPVSHFYQNISIRDFYLDQDRLGRSLDFICICHKSKK